MATLKLPRFIALGNRSSDPFETDPSLRAVREYVAASRAARLRAFRSDRRAEVILRQSAVGAVLALVATLSGSPARAEDHDAVCARNGWDTCAVKGYEACATIAAQACLLKPETRICSPDGRRCWYIGIDNYVAVRRIEGNRVFVMTEGGPAVGPLNMLVSTPSGH